MRPDLPPFLLPTERDILACVLDYKDKAGAGLTKHEMKVFIVFMQLERFIFQSFTMHLCMSFYYQEALVTPKQISTALRLLNGKCRNDFIKKNFHSDVNLTIAEDWRRKSFQKVFTVVL